MRAVLLQAVLAMCLLSGCGSRSIKPAEALDERSGMTVGALQEPIEFVQSAQNAASAGAKRASFAYVGPVEWDLSGDVTYGLWIHVAPGSDRQIADLRTRDSVTLVLDDGSFLLVPIEAPRLGHGPYRSVASWGQSGYFGIGAGVLKRMAASQKLMLRLRAVDDSVMEFIPSHETRSTLTQFVRARGITGD